MVEESPYLLLTPGPLSTTPSVRDALRRELSTRDPAYAAVCNSIRDRLVTLAVRGSARADHTTVLMQGSGTFAVEATLGTAVPPDGRVLILINGAYGERMAAITERLGIDTVARRNREAEPVDVDRLGSELDRDPSITHVAYVHCETTTGMLNDAAAIGRVTAAHGVSVIVDAMSSFGGVPLDMVDIGADYLVSSANKCIQGVPGFGYVIARRDVLERTAGWARSVSLDLHAQWQEMEASGGGWRYTSPTHAVLAFERALDELDAEGGVSGRHARYTANQRALVVGLTDLGFRTLLPRELQSPIITTFDQPRDDRFDFETLFEKLKTRRFMIYPGKVTGADTFRIGTIGNVFPDDIDRLLVAMTDVVAEMGFSPGGEAS